MWSLDTLISVLVAGSAVVTAYFAWRGLSAWRAQMLGQHAFEAARGLMRAAYRLRGAAQTARFPWMDAGEVRAALHDEGLSTEDAAKIASDDAFMAVVRARWRSVEVARTEFNVAVMEAKIVLGIAVEECAKPMRKCLVDLYAAINAQASAQAGQSRISEEQSRTASYTSDDRNVGAFTGRLDDAVRSVEAGALPFLHRAQN